MKSTRVTASELRDPGLRGLRLRCGPIRPLEVMTSLAKASDDSAAGQPHQQARDTRLLEQSQPPAGSGHPEQDPGVTPQAASSLSSQEGEETDNTVCSVSTQPGGRRPHKPRQLPASRLTLPLSTHAAVSWRSMFPNKLRYQEKAVTCPSLPKHCLRLLRGPWGLCLSPPRSARLGSRGNSK